MIDRHRGHQIVPVKILHTVPDFISYYCPSYFGRSSICMWKIVSCREIGVPPAQRYKIDVIKNRTKWAKFSFIFFLSRIRSILSVISGGECGNVALLSVRV